MLNQFKNIFSSSVSNQDDVNDRQKDSSYVPKNYLLAETVEFLIKEGETLDNQGELERALS